ncbi:MAG TPA: ATP-dependent helicase, partial [Ferruginibacter sp.]|nr:ATP-dependent helicase [Ferruginibacter sp.]
IKKMAQSILHHPVEVSISMSKPPEKIVQKAFMVYDAQKIAAVLHILRDYKYKFVLIFLQQQAKCKTTYQGAKAQ